MYTIERQNLRYIEHSHHNLIQDVEFFIPKEHQDFLSELESLIELPNDDSSSPKRQIPKQKKIKKLQKVVKEQKVKTKNFFTNIGTYLKHYMHKKCNQKELAMFFSIFGRKRSYKSMKKFSNLFASPLQKYCIQFFTTEVLKQFIKSNTADKSLLIKYLAVLRQGAIKGQINILKY